MTNKIMNDHSTLKSIVKSEISKRFVNARYNGQALKEFPGTLPQRLSEAYAIQNHAIELWPDTIGGWKVGRIPVDVESKYGIDRLAGPIFNSQIHLAKSDAPTTMSMFKNGFGAIEAEYVAIIAEDTPKDKVTWSLDETKAVIKDLCIGIEIASSPLPTINELGPAAVVSDFGNNNGLIIGPSIEGWQERDLETMHCESFIEGQSVGTGGAFQLDGGYLRSVQFLLELAAQRGLPLKAGQVIATGQTNGIHDVLPGQATKIDFGKDGLIECLISKVEPKSA